MNKQFFKDNKLIWRVIKYPLTAPAKSHSHLLTRPSIHPPTVNTTCSSVIFPIVACPLCYLSAANDPFPGHSFTPALSFVSAPQIHGHYESPAASHGKTHDPLHSGHHLDCQLRNILSDALRVHHVRHAAGGRGGARRLLQRVARWTDNIFHPGDCVSSGVCLPVERTMRTDDVALVLLRREVLLKCFIWVSCSLIKLAERVDTFEKCNYPGDFLGKNRNW